MTNIIDGLIEIAVNNYFKHDDDKRYNVIASTVLRWALICIYEKLLREKEIEPIENSEKKEEYWLISYHYSQDKNVRIEQSKALYTLELITSTY